MKKIIKIVFPIVFLVVLGFFSYYLTSTFQLVNNFSKEEDKFDDLRDLRQTQSTIAPTETADTPVEVLKTLEMLEEYQQLYDENNDFIGWINVPDTKVDFPVMHTPDQPEKYLYKNFKENGSSYGTPFLDGYCGTDSDCIAIYGHNMNNGAMFSSLGSYRKLNYMEEHPLVAFDTLYEKREYQVFAAMEVQNNTSGANGIYDFIGDLNEESFDEMMQLIDTEKLYDTDLRPEYGDQILLLSTCSNHVNDGRFLVAAYRSVR